MKAKRIVTVIYGIVAVAAGAWRQMETGTSPQALWFGVAVGLLAVVGAVLLGAQNRIPGYALILISLGFESGWFLHRMFSGHSEGKSVRVIVVLAMCAIELVVLLWRSPSVQAVQTGSVESA